MAEFIYLNGEIVSADRARVSPFDRGLLYGDGLFETMLLRVGRVHLLRRHLERLRESAASLGIRLPSHERLINAVERTILANDARDGALRLTVTRGVGGTVFDIDPERQPTVMVTTRELPGVGPSGEKLITLGAIHRPPAFGRRVKSLDYTTAVHAATELRAAGVREGILLAEDGTVASGSVSNIFIIRDRTLITPPLSMGILPGITRGRLMELAPACSLKVREEMFDLETLLTADECLYTNSLRGIVRVDEVDGRPVGRGIPYGSMLISKFWSEVPNEWI